MDDVLILSASDVKNLVSMRDIINAVEEAFGKVWERHLPNCTDCPDYD